LRKLQVGGEKATDHVEGIGHEGKRMNGIAWMLCQYIGGRATWMIARHTGNEFDKEEDGIDRQEDAYPRRL